MRIAFVWSHHSCAVGFPSCDTSVVKLNFFAKPWCDFFCLFVCIFLRYHADVLVTEESYHVSKQHKYPHAPSSITPSSAVIRAEQMSSPPFVPFCRAARTVLTVNHQKGLVSCSFKVWKVRLLWRRQRRDARIYNRCSGVLMVGHDPICHSYLYALALGTESQDVVVEIDLYQMGHPFKSTFRHLWCTEVLRFCRKFNMPPSSVMWFM